MKKGLFLTAAVISLAMTAGAAADTTVTQTGTVADARWISDTNLLRVRDPETGFYRMASSDGTVLTDTLFGSSFDYRSGYVAVRSTEDGVNTMGAVNLDGESLIDFTYGDIKILNENWILGVKLSEADANNYDYESWIGESYYLIDTVDVYHLADGQVTGSQSFTRDNYQDSSVSGDYIKIQNRTDGTVTMYDGSFGVAAENLNTVYDDGDIQTEPYTSFRGNDLYGIQDAEGNVVVEPAYGYIDYIRGGVAKVERDGKKGLIDLSGNVLVPTEYDDIINNYSGPVTGEGNALTAAGYAAVVKDEKVGFTDLEGNVTLEPKYSKDLLEVNGASALLKDLEGNIHILAADGKDTVLDGTHSDVDSLNYTNGLIYRFTGEDDRYGVIDWHGEEVLPAEYTSISVSGDGLLILADVNYDESAVFSVSYDTGSGAAPAEEAAADGAESVAEASEEVSEPDMSAVSALISSARTLLDADYESNRGAIASLIENAAAQLGGNRPEVKALLDSVKTLMDSEDGAAEPIGALLDEIAAKLEQQ